MKKKAISFDTMAIVDCVVCYPSILHIQKTWNRRNTVLLISTRVEGEAINRLQKEPYEYTEEEAKKSVRLVIKTLKLKREKFDKIKDNQAGRKLVKKYENRPENCHYPDSCIIAHLKRIKVRVIVSRDQEFKKVAKQEGFEVEYIPTQESIMNRRFAQLFRGRR